MFQLQDIQSDSRFLVFGNSTNTNYKDADLNRNINRWYETGLAWILQSDGEWQVNGDIAVCDLVAGQREYTLPTDTLVIDKVYIQSNTTGADYLVAIQKDLSGIKRYNEEYHPQIPEYDLLDNSIFIYIPDDTITAVPSGLKIVYQKDFVALANSTDAPNIAEPFKRLLSVGAAMDYCKPNEKWNKLATFKKDIYGDPTVKNDDGIKGDLIAYYASKSVVKPVVIQAEIENFI